jgi:branched-chain amino acid transport system substrate-binding protein
MFRRSLLLGALAVPLLGASSDSPLRIGVLTSTTGPLAQHGKRQLQGAQHRAGAGGHGHGGGAELLIRDIGEAPQDAVYGLLEEGVHALIGLVPPAAAVSIMDAANTSCTPLMTTGPSGGDYVFPAAPAPAKVAQAMLKAVRESGFSKAGVLAMPGPGTPLAENALDYGVTVTGTDPVPLDSTDLKPLLAPLLTPAPEILVLDLLPPLDAYAARDARAAGWTGPMLFGPATANPAFHTQAGPAAEGVRAVAPWVASATPPAELPNATVIRRFTSTFAGSPDPYAGFAADAMSLLNLAFLGHRDRKEAKAQLDKMCCVGVTGVYNPQLSDDALTVLTANGGAWG